MPLAVDSEPTLKFACVACITQNKSEFWTSLHIDTLKLTARNFRVQFLCRECTYKILHVVVKLQTPNYSTF